MKKFAALVAAASVMSTAAFAGGPVAVEVDPTPIAVVAPASSGSLGAGAVVAGLAGLALVAALVANDSGDH